MKKILFFPLIVLFFGCASTSSRRPANDGNAPELIPLVRESAVSLRWRGAHFCSGFLIEPKKVLTAAHCLKKFSRFPVEVQKRELTLEIFGQKITGGFTIYRTKDYDPNELPKNTVGDMALFVLKQPVQVRNPIKLPKRFEPREGDRYFTVGYGPSPNYGAKDRGIGGIRTTSLQFDVEETYAPYLIFKNGPSREGMVCGGDSGSPAFLLENGKLVLVGVLSAARSVGTDEAEEFERNKEENKKKFSEEYIDSKSCSFEVGIGYWTRVDLFLDFIEDPKKNGILHRRIP